MHAVETQMNPPTLARLETDRLCHCCGYNLHGQAVWRDERLQILLCRCPECGQHHPAEGGVTMGSLWLRRMTSLMLIAWVLCIVLASGTMLVVQFVFAISSLDRRSIHQFMVVTRLEPGGTDYGRFEVIASILSVGLISFSLHAVWSLLAQHIAQRKLLLLAIFPLLTTCIAALISSNVERQAYGRGFWIVLGCLLASTIVGLIVAQLLARPFWRSTTELLIPPKHRAALSTLWTSDGRTPPGA